MLGQKMGVEAPFHDGGASNPLVSPEAARVELARLESDKAFADSLLDIRHPMHLTNTQRHSSLQKVAYGKRS
jgi:hypothetical protein